MTYDTSRVPLLRGTVSAEQVDAWLAALITCNLIWHMDDDARDCLRDCGLSEAELASIETSHHAAWASIGSDIWNCPSLIAFIDAGCGE